MKYTVQAVIFNENREVLAVSRKDDHNDYGLVGGKVDDEDWEYSLIMDPLKYAMRRECMEETGLELNMDTAEVVLQIHKDGYMSITYLIHDWSGKINYNEPHVVTWTHFNTLIEGSFGKYNQLVAESLADMGIDFIIFAD
jgi:8-oxo-dGTP pyrophosphatase MutT (NUDIX family)